MRHRILFVILLISLVIGACTLRRGHEWGDDFAWYILQAQSILNGTTDEFMQTSAFTNNESTTYVGPLAYPVVFFRGVFSLFISIIKSPPDRGGEFIARWFVCIQSPAPPIP